jgi:hypothetical protein
MKSCVKPVLLELSKIGNNNKMKTTTNDSPPQAQKQEIKF